MIRPDGKGIAGEIRVRLQSTLQQYHANMPQFAYIPGRGIQDAQLRVLAHVRRVKQLLQTHLRSKRARKVSGHINWPHLQGGFIFSLDLYQAFDKVKGQEILDALADVGASQADIELLASLRRNSTYIVKFGSSRGSFRSTTGIKQGCTLAPSLFSLVTSYIFKKVGQDVSAEEVEGFLTRFADDLIVHKDIYCWRDLEIAHQLALSLLAHLEAAGFAVNPTKCCIMYRLKGRLLAKARKLCQCTELRDGKAVPLWRLTPYNPPRALSGEAAPLTALHGATGFPIVRHFKCLGSQLSYHNHADLTLTFRQQQAASKTAKVRKFVNSRRGSGTASRLLVWRASRQQDSLSREPGRYRPGLADNSERLSISQRI